MDPVSKEISGITFRGTLPINYYQKADLIRDLLEANNRYLMRARSSEGLLQEALDELLFRSNKTTDLVKRLREHLKEPWNR